MKKFIKLIYFSFLFFSQSVFAEKIAVVSFSLNSNKIAERIVQARIEDILADNEFEVIDREKLKEFKNNWNELSDPTMLITAEKIIEQQQKFHFDRLLVANIVSEHTKGVGGIYLASANVDLRFINSDANVKSYSSLTMGTFASPLSEGNTSKSAVINALRRAVESTLIKQGMNVYDQTINKAVKLKVEKHLVRANNTKQYSITKNASNSLFDTLDNNAKKWTKQKQSCSVKVKGTSLMAVGIKTIKTNLMSRRRTYNSSIYIYDEKEKLILNQFNIESSTRKAADQRKKSHSSEIQDCEFINTWKYIAVTTRNQIKVFETERGVEITAIAFDHDMQNNKIHILKGEKDDYISVVSNDNIQYFKLSK